MWSKGRVAQRSLRPLAVAGAVLGLVVAACGAPPEEGGNGSGNGSDNGAAEGPEDFKACMISDSGGFDDKSFNETSHKGLTDARDDLGIDTAQLESNSDSEYPTNINTMIEQDCSIIVTVGFKLGDDTYSAAEANPDVFFAIVDYDYDPAEQPPLDNLKSLVFNTAEPSFMAGYLAAGMSETGAVGTLGGIKIPTVTIFMDGFAEGVAYYNEQNDADVDVLGWDDAAQEGTFTDDFENRNLAQNSANNLISQGADIIFPVAGPAGLGALQAADDAGDDVTAIWVDTDGCVSAAEYCPQLLTSVNKGMDLAVQRAITSAYNDDFDNTPYVGTLDNDGVGIAPFHEFEDVIPAELQQEVEALAPDIIDGSIEIRSESQPAEG